MNFASIGDVDSLTPHWHAHVLQPFRKEQTLLLGVINPASLCSLNSISTAARFLVQQRHMVAKLAVRQSIFHQWNILKVHAVCTHVGVNAVQVILSSPRGRAWNQYSPSLGSTMNVAFLAQVYSEYIKAGGSEAERRAKRYSCWAQTQVGLMLLVPLQKFVWCSVDYLLAC